MVVDCDEVDEERGSADEGGEEEGGGHHLTDPDLKKQETKNLFTCL